MFTTGSLSLKDVFSSTGTPVPRLKALISSRYAGLDSRLAAVLCHQRVCVRQFPLLIPNRINHQHEWGRVVSLKPRSRILFEDGRREGTEVFQVFYPLTQDILHLGAARVGNNAAVPERARPPLGPPAFPQSPDHGRHGKVHDLERPFAIVLFECLHLANFSALRSPGVSSPAGVRRMAPPWHGLPRGDGSSPPTHVGFAQHPRPCPRPYPWPWPQPGVFLAEA